MTTVSLKPRCVFVLALSLVHFSRSVTSATRIASFSQVPGSKISSSVATYTIHAIAPQDTASLNRGSQASRPVQKEARLFFYTDLESSLSLPAETSRSEIAGVINPGLAFVFISTKRIYALFGGPPLSPVQTVTRIFPPRVSAYACPFSPFSLVQGFHYTCTCVDCIGSGVNSFLWQRGQ